MGDAVGATLGYAMGIAISPIPIAAVILMLFSGRARSNSVSFLAAWIAGIAAVTAVVVAVPGLETDDAAPSTTTGWVKLALGVLLLAVGVRRWSSQRGPIVAHLVAAARLDPTLDRTKAWLIDNNAAVMAVLLLVFGVSLLGDSIEILA
ncbi:MAG: GAP family protein [Jiangellales bacterium]